MTPYLRGENVVAMIVMSTVMDDGRALTAADLWRAFWRAGAPIWEAALSMSAHLGGRPYTYIDVRLICLTPACRRSPDGAPL